MKLEQRLWTKTKQWVPQGSQLDGRADLVLIFGETALLKDKKTLAEIKECYPKAHLFGCSTSGEIQDTRVYDDSIAVTAIQFQHTSIQAGKIRMTEVKDSCEAGTKLAAQLNHKDLTHVLVLSVGLGVNGSDLVKGLTDALPKNVTVTGGLAGDQDRFTETLVISDGEAINNMVAVIGLYGKNIQVSSASLGGWDSFGPERMVTKAEGNVLYELDGKSALSLYKSYLGDHVKDLPGSALLFPLSLRGANVKEGLVRTILAVDEKNQSMTFAGDIPMNSYARFMMANFDRLIGGAIGAAERSQSGTTQPSPELALLISCVGRKIVLKQRIEEEVEGVRSIFGDKTVLTGFYSYGEISPFTPNAKCELHNQTMTITTIRESSEDAA